MKRPNVVAIGGGHGLAATLRAARSYAHELTAVVSVADDGGSSGRLRELTGLPAVGDIRRCLSALADPVNPLASIFEQRFDGHALGNVMLVAMAQERGDLTAAVREFRDLLGVRATILPATNEPVVLVAETDAGAVRGQVAIKRTTGIKRVSLEPAEPEASPGTIAALAAADQVVIGPGSLFTSVLAVVAVPAIRDAVAASRATKVYVANLADELETAGFDDEAAVAALVDHGVRPDVVVSGSPDLAAVGGRAHDPQRLAVALAELAGC